MSTSENINNNEVVVKAENVRKSFNGTVVIDDVSFELRKKENLAIMGRSGSGKSVLIKNIVGLLVPNKGSLKVLGKEVKNLDEDEMVELRRSVGYLFQGGALYDSMTVERNLKFPLRRLPGKPSEAEVNDRVDEMLENVGLLDAKQKYPEELSGGMKKRIALARTLVLKPEIMLYDEPTTGLDVITSNEISELILEMREKYAISSIIITHDIACVEKTTDKVMILKDGNVLTENSYDNLANSEDYEIRSYFKVN